MKSAGKIKRNIGDKTVKANSFITENSTSKDVAIVGIACRFPGANNYDEFWRNLECGVDSVREVPPERWNTEEYYSRNIDEPNKSNSKWFGVVDNIDRFDNGFFNISTREAKNMDPQQRILMEETWRCIEDSGIPLSKLQNAVTSVIVGAMAIDYYQNIHSPKAQIDGYAGMGVYHSMLSNRLSYFLGFTGESKTVDTACSSTLSALYDARQLLYLDQCDYALVASVNLNINPSRNIMWAKNRMLSPEGKCKTFDKDANGFVSGEGAGVLLLRPLYKAVEEKNNIYGVIKGIAINHGGRSRAFTVPKVASQRDVILAAYEDSGISADTITYVEAHGTGTSLGDPIEIEALTQAFRKYTRRNCYCKIGSVKTNIGHLESASGAAGLFKVLMMLKHRKIPRTLNINTINPIIDFKETPFCPATELDVWKSAGEGMPLRAGISAFGLGGVNVHVVVEEYNVKKEVIEEEDTCDNLFVLSAKSTDSLKMMLAEWNTFIESERFSTLSLHEICRTMLTGRNAFSYRWGKIVKSKKELAQRLKEADMRDTHKKSEKPWCLMAGDVPPEECFRFVHLTKERELFSGVLELVKSAAMELEDGEKLWEGLLNNRTEEGLCSLFPFIGSFTLLAVLKELGLSPAVVTGCKNGTWAALALSGMMALKDILRLLSGAGELRSMEIRRPIVYFYDPIEGATLKPFKFDKEYMNFIKDGLAEGMEAIYDDCVAKARLLLDNQYTFKRYMEEWCEAFKKFGLDLDKVLYSEKPGTGDDLDEAEKLLLLAAIISSLQKLNRKWDFTRKTSVCNKKFAELLDLVTDEVMPPEGLIELLVSANPDCEALACKLNERQDRMNLANPYLYIRNFSKNITEKKDVYHWIEELLSGETVQFDNITSQNIAVIGDIPVGQVPAAVNLGMKTGDELEKVLLELWLRGADVKWSNLYVDGSFYRVPLPTYSFNREVFWMERKTDVHTGEVLHPLIEKNISDFNGVAFESLFTGKEFFLAHHVVNLQKILPGVAYLEAGRAAGEFAAKKQAKYLRKVTWLRPFILSDTCNRLKIDVRTEDQNGIICEFSTQDVNKQRVVCGNVEVIFGDLTDHREYFDFEAVKRRCNYSLQGNDCYDFFNSISLKYGESFKTIKEFWCNENEAVSRLELSDNYVDSLDSFVMHPGIMDGALQTVLNLIYYKISDVKRPFMPFSMEELEIVSEVKQKGFAYVKAAENNLYHVALLDEEGSVCIKMKGISFREMKADDEFFYMPVWMPMQPEQSNLIADSDVGGEGNVLIVYPQDAFALKKALTDCHNQEKVFSIILGEQTRQLSESDWEINIKESLAIDSCMSAMGEVQSVYFLGGTSAQSSDILNPELIDQSVERYLLSLLRLVKSLNDRGYSARHLNIKIVTHNVYRITGNDGINPLGAALNGMAKSIAMEYGRWRVCCIDTDYSGASNEMLTGQVRGVMDEPWNNKGEIVALRKGQRYVRKINPVLLLPIEDNPFRSCGVYLIIGGGGIGLELGRYLATEVQARLVLVGRSEPDPVRRKAMEDIESAGGKVTYIQADVCDMASMKRVIEKTKELYGRIHGVFHSAIVLRDKSIGNMEEETLLSVLAPKVRGSVVLMKALEGESLDFVMFFSSVQSFMGNSGQSNYAAACAFKDAFAGYQGQERSYKVRTINWGYWGSVGIVATEEYSKRLSAKGLKSIRPEEGMEAIKRVLLYHGDQVIAMKADKHFLESIGGDADSTWEAYPAVMEPILNTRLNINNQPLIESAVLEQSHLGLKRLEELSCLVLLKAFPKMGVFLSGNMKYERTSLRKLLRIVPKYTRLFDAFMDILSSAGFIHLNGEIIFTDYCLEQKELLAELEDMEKLKTELLSVYPDLQSHINLLWNCFESYPDILTGDVSATNLIFPHSSMELVEGIYRGSAIPDFCNELGAWGIEAFIESRIPRMGPNEKVRICEIGAGTGATSAVVFEKIRKYQDRISYVYTDISISFTQHGRQLFGESNPYVEFKVLNIENEPDNQGFKPGDFDMVIATNIIHATKNIEVALANVKKLLKTNGWFILNEVTHVYYFNTLTFGLLDGWWLHHDARMKHSPLLDISMWQKVLEVNGFRNVRVLDQRTSDGKILGQNVFISESDGFIKRTGSTHKRLMPEMIRPGKENIESQKVSGKAYQVASHGMTTTPSVSITQKAVGRQVAVGEEDIDKHIVECIVKSLAAVLQKNEEGFSPDIPYSEFGVDSILAVEIINKINEALKIELRSTDLFNYSTVGTLCKYISGRFGDVLGKNIKSIPQKNVGRQASTRKDDIDGYITEVIKKSIAGVLQKSEEEFNITTPYSQFGVDSILAVEIINKINEALGIELRSTDLFNYSTIGTLCKYISERSGDALEKLIIKPNSFRVDEYTAEKSLEDRRFETDIFSSSMAQMEDRQGVLPEQGHGITNNSSVSKETKTFEIAVIGMSGRFPDAENVEEFWHNLNEGRNSVREITRWDLNEYYDPNRNLPNKSYSKWGGLLEDISQFDPYFFNISPREAEMMDPQQRLLLEEAWKALEDAGYSDKALENHKCGVFVGCMPSYYDTMLRDSNISPDAFSFMGNSQSILSARIAYFLNLKGPSVTVDTACSSSLVAVHLACESIWSGTSEMALAGGVAALATPHVYVLACSAGMLSPDGQCKAFDYEANGFVPGDLLNTTPRYTFCLCIF